MNGYIFFMHDDAPREDRHPDHKWNDYFAKLRGAGAFEGGSAIGDGICASKSSTPPPSLGRFPATFASGLRT